MCIYESLTQSSSFPNSPSTALTVTLMHPSPENKRKPKAFMITITKKFYIYSHRTSIYLFQRQPSSKTSTLYLPPFLSYSNPGLSSFIPQETLFTHTHTHTHTHSLSLLTRQCKFPLFLSQVHSEDTRAYRIVRDGVGFPYLRRNDHRF